MVYHYIFLINNDIKLLFIYLLAICVSYICNKNPSGTGFPLIQKSFLTPPLLLLFHTFYFIWIVFLNTFCIHLLP